jgi:hypothetical protein
MAIIKHAVVAMKEKVQCCKRAADSSSHTDGKMEHKVRNQYAYMCTLGILGFQHPKFKTNVKFCRARFSAPFFYLT